MVATPNGRGRAPDERQPQWQPAPLLIFFSHSYIWMSPWPRTIPLFRPLLLDSWGGLYFTFRMVYASFLGWFLLDLYGASEFIFRLFLFFCVLLLLFCFVLFCLFVCLGGLVGFLFVCCCLIRSLVYAWFLWWFRLRVVYVWFLRVCLLDA